MRQYDIAVYGLGVMGSSLAKNMISHGFSVAAYSKSEEERIRFGQEKEGGTVCGDVTELLQILKSPRCIFLMITAGKPVDSVLEELLPMLSPGDIVMDGGNSYYKDTVRRVKLCAASGVSFLGIGVSGGEQGALNGPCMMAGGAWDAWETVRPILQTISAQSNGTPCCSYIGADGAGHYVKMVHNGIEYALLQLISEVWYFMKHGLHMQTDEIIDCFSAWQDGALNCYLLEISLLVLKKNDVDGRPLVDRIRDVAGQKGTGKWTLMDSLERGVYIPTIYEAVLARSFSAKKELRIRGDKHLASSGTAVSLHNPEKQIGDALLMGMILCYSQGLELIAKASEEEQWNIDFSTLTDVWKDGCIIRSSLLGKIQDAAVTPEEPLIFSPVFSCLNNLEPALRELTEKSVSSGIPLTGMTSALHYYEYYRMKEMPVNFIQALRDCFGAHTYERTDRDGHFHTKWEA